MENIQKSIIVLIYHRHKLLDLNYKCSTLQMICYHAKSIYCTPLELLATFMAAMLLLLIIRDVGNNHQRPDEIIDHRLCP
jgi:hypothetical protein